MEDGIRERVGDTEDHADRVPDGRPVEPPRSRIVNADEARSIVVLGGGEDGVGDAEAVKAVLAVMTQRLATRRRRPSSPSSTTSRPRDALHEATGGRVITVRAVDVIARITAQACRQPGLSFVWQDLLDFAGDEIYFQPAPELEGHTYGEALLAFEASSVIGRRERRRDDRGEPADGHRLRTRRLRHRDLGRRRHRRVLRVRRREPRRHRGHHRRPSGLERLLVVGWSHLGPFVLRELDQFAPPGSTVDVLVDPDLVDPGERRSTSSSSKLRRDVPRRPAATSTTQRIGPAPRVRQRDHPRIPRGISPAEADARALLTLLLLQRALANDGSRAAAADRHRAARLEGRRARPRHRRRRLRRERRAVEPDARPARRAVRARAGLRRPVRRRGLGRSPCTPPPATSPAAAVPWRRIVAAARGEARRRSAIGLRWDPTAGRRSSSNPPKTSDGDAGNRRPGRRDRAGVGTLLRVPSVSLPRGPYDLVRRLLGDVVQAGWSWAVDVGTIRPGHRRAQRFARFGQRSAICFPVGALFGESSIELGDGLHHRSERDALGRRVAGAGARTGPSSPSATAA